MPSAALVAWLHAWIFSLIVLLSPIEKAVQHTHLPAAMETVAERTARMHSIAEDISTVVLNSEEVSIFGRSLRGRASTAALIVAVDWMESGFRKDVDFGIGKDAKGGGMDNCLSQVRLYGEQKTKEGWTAEELTADRTKCIRAGLHLLARSWGACSKEDEAFRLAAYASGACDRSQGRMKSVARVNVFHRLLAQRLPEPPKEEEPLVPAPAAGAGASRDLEHENSEGVRAAVWESAR